MREKLRIELLAQKVIVILRGVKPEEVIEVGEIIAAAGGRFLEVPLNTPRALESIRLAAGHFKNTEVRIGAGTVLHPEQVDVVATAGGTYIISPNTVPAVIARTRDLGLLSLPGFATPTEAFTAIDAGADILKCFPCVSPGHIAVLKSVIPLPVFAVGGISAENRDEYLKTADGIGVGIGLYRSGMIIEELHRAAKAFMTGIK